MIDFEIGACKKNSELYENNEVIFIITDNSNEKIDNLCKRVSEEIGSIVDWNFVGDCYSVKTTKDYIEKVVKVGMEIILNEFDTVNVLYRKDNEFIPLYVEYSVISSVKTGDFDGLKQWCKKLSNNIIITSNDVGDKLIWSKRPVNDFHVVKAEKINCPVKFKSFNFHNPFKSLLENLKYAQKYDLKYERVIDCAESNTNKFLKGRLRKMNFISNDCEIEKQLQLNEVLDSFESISKKYYNKYSKRWVIVGSVKDKEEILSKIIMI